MSALTNAGYAYHVARVSRLTANVQAGLAEGMWNPNFCSADAGANAISYLDDLERIISNIKSILNRSESPTPAHKER